jgi:hypothetical protein
MWNGTSVRCLLEIVEVLVEVRNKRHPSVRHQRWNLIGVKCLNIYLNCLSSEGVTH